MSAIRCFARAVAEKFQPEKIILFGSYAHGKPNEDSDVDILVVMPGATNSTRRTRFVWRFRLRSRWISSSALPRTCIGASRKGSRS